MKSLVGLKDLRAKDPDFARLWINTARLAEDDLPALDPEAPDSLPWPHEPSRSADLAPRRHGPHQPLCRRPEGPNPVDLTRLAAPSPALTASKAPRHRSSASTSAPMGLDPRVHFAAR